MDGSPPIDSNMSHDSDSTPQRAAQLEVLAVLNARHGWSLEPEQLVQFGSNRIITLDGLDRKNRIAVEMSAHIGKRSASRDHKVLQDAARLLLVRRLMGHEYKLVIALCDDKFHASCDRPSKKWHAGYLELMDIDVELVGLSQTSSDAIRTAQLKQKAGNQGPNLPRGV